MGSTTEPPLDEKLWQEPLLAVKYAGIHSNSVLFYFAASPFFDPTSNNASLYTQCVNNASMVHYVETRAAFESRLREMQGLEFVVSHDPLQPPYSPYPYGQAPSNVWVIKKQRRRKQRGMQDEVTVLGVYFVVGETVLMAPKVEDVLTSRMLSVITSLTKFLSTASTLPIFTPGLGYTYIPPSLKPSKGPNSASLTSSASAQPSREGTPLAEVTSFNSSTSKASQAKTSTSGSFTDSNILADSFRRSNAFGNEYMDDSPLVGEPGSFIISKPQTQKGHEKSSSQTLNQLKQIAGKSAGTSNTNTPAPPSPLEVKTDAMAGKKASGGQKSPTTPGATSAGGPLKEKPKRRKSKAPISGQP